MNGPVPFERTATFFLVLSLLLPVFSYGEVFEDNFDTPHDFIADGTAGTIWDGFVGLGAGETVSKLNASIDNNGRLYISSAGARWEPNWNPRGPFLYMTTEYDFTVTVRVVDTANIEWNVIGLMARVADINAAGPGEDFECVDYFRKINGHLGRSVNNGGEIEWGKAALKPYLRLRKEGSSFYHEISDDGLNWTLLAGSPKVREDMRNLPLQVGIQQATYTSNSGFGVFDEFRLETFPPTPEAKPLFPADDELNIDIESGLSWLTGHGATSHDVFLGVDADLVANAVHLIGDLDGDGRINMADFVIMVTQWLGGACQGTPCADLVPNQQVDLQDLLALTNDWLQESSEQFRGRVELPATSIDVGLLDYDTTYFWRIDAIDEMNGSIVPNDVWSFRTKPFEDAHLRNEYFDMKFEHNAGGVVLFNQRNDPYGTDYVMNDSHYQTHNKHNPGWLLGDVLITYRLDGGVWQDAKTHLSDDNREIAVDDINNTTRLDITYLQDSAHTDGIRDFDLTETWQLDGNRMTLDITLSNTTGSVLEIGDFGFPLPFYTVNEGPTSEVMTGRVMKHSFMAGHGSYAYWMRVNGTEPYLLMTAAEQSRFEYFHIFNESGRWEGNYVAYMHSGVTGPAAAGTWRQNHTTKVLQPGEELSLNLVFSWQDSYDDIRQTLYNEGELDIDIVPGMSLPQDLHALVKIRTQGTIETLTAEYPAETTITYAGSPQADTYIYKIEFQKLGENIITINHDGGQETILEFFSTEPLETLIKKRSSHIVNYQQVRNPAKWYDGLFGLWDARTQELRTPDNNDGFTGWWGYVLTCDDPGLGHAPYVASKNVRYPDPCEIEAVEYYLENFVWGGLQRTDTETPNPYGIYGVPSWYEHRVLDPDPGHVWRVFDYPHIVMLYHHMYEIAKKYPELVSYLDKEGYLERAYQTAMRYYLLGSWGYNVGTYNELVFEDVIAALRTESRNTDADTLETEWRKKTISFIESSNYGSEYSMDTTAFESTHAFARWAMEHDVSGEVTQQQIDDFMIQQMRGNIAVRGWLEPAYYFYGSDYRAAGSSEYTLSYMAQMGGWAVLDYALNYAANYGDDPVALLRLSYASYLSSWALMNTGTPASNYGYWFPGEANDGAVGWAFEPKKNTTIWLLGRYLERGIWYYDGEIDLGLGGALRMARAIVVDDPIFGLFGYGCDVIDTGTNYEMLIKDGLREYLIMHNMNVSLKLDRDAYSYDIPITISKTKDAVQFQLDNETLTAHNTRIALTGLAAGDYQVKVNDDVQSTVTMTPEITNITFAVPADSTCGVTIERISN